MADLTPLLRDIAGVYVDRARDRLPDGSVWQMTDWVPEVLQAGARMRGRWTFQSTALPLAPDGMIYAPYFAASRLLAASGTGLYEIPLAAPGSPGAAKVTIPQTAQNPVFHRNTVVVPAANGNLAAKYVTFDGTSYVGTDAQASALQGRYACVFKDRLVLGGSGPQPTRVAFSKPGNPPATAWNANSFADTSYRITGLAAQRTQILVFHASSVERLRGSTPPDSDALPADQPGDLILDVLFDRAGCYDARSIASWNDNIVFCDARGVFLTDGAVVRNVADQAGMMNMWRLSFTRGGLPPLSIAGVVHQDYYICTLRHTGLPPVTFVTDLPTRRMFMLSNIDTTCYAFSIGTTEELYGVDAASKRVTYLTRMFIPDNTVLQVDENGLPVLPSLSTGWSLLTKDVGFKRVVEMHVTYEAHRDDDAEVLRAWYTNSPSGTDQLLGEFRVQNQYGRKIIPVRRRLPGFGATLTQLLPTKDTRLYEISLRAYPEEQSRV